MKRRSVLAGAASAPLIASFESAAMQTSEKKPSILELSWIRMRNTPDNQRKRLADFCEQLVAPALKRVTRHPFGFFMTAVGPDAPSALIVMQHDNIQGYLDLDEKLMADATFSKGVVEYAAGPLPYMRNQVALLEGFKGFPSIEVPPGDAKRPARMFELRTYESNTGLSLSKKIGMFEAGEIDLFRKFGLLPVFFGRMIAGDRMPNLTYMVAFDNLAAREANWRAFATSAEWKKMSATPGLSDGEVVSNISNVLLTPMAGSMIR